MKKESLAMDQMKARTILPFEIKQAIIALELGDTDWPILKYMDFLSRKIPLASAHFTHVLPTFDLSRALFDKDAPSIMGQYTYNKDWGSIMKEKVALTSIGQGKSHLAFDLFQGDPLEVLIRQVIDIKADLLVIGQKAHTKSHAILAKNLARKTNGNILIIPENAQPTLKTILVPIDFSNASVQALEVALSIYKQMKAQVKIVCLYVYSIPDFNTFRFDNSWIQVKSVVESNIEDAFDSFLNTYACQEKDCIEKALMYKEHPDTGSHIIQYATDHAANMIIMGATGHSNVHLLLMGSVAEKVISINDDIPVILVRQKEN